MSIIEFYLIFESILYGLIVTQFFLDWNKLIFSAKNLKIYWSHLLLSLTIFFQVLLRFNGRLKTLDQLEQINSSFIFLLETTMGPALLYLITYQIFPQRPERTDLDEFIMDRHKKIGFAIFLYGMYQGIRNIHLGQPISLTAPLILFGLLYLVFVFWKNSLYFKIVTLLGFIASCYFMVIT